MRTGTNAYTASYDLDDVGNWTSRTVNGGARWCWRSRAAPTSAAYTYGEALLTRGGEVMHTDGHGDLRAVTDGGQNVAATGNYETYGTLVGGTGSSSTPYQYGATSGYRNDGDAGLMHVGARWYDPAIGRWMSADTYLGDQMVPASRNRFLYCEDDPANRVDPSGHFGIGDLAGGLMTLLGAALVATSPGWVPYVVLFAGLAAVVSTTVAVLSQASLQATRIAEGYKARILRATRKAALGVE